MTRPSSTSGRRVQSDWHRRCELRIARGDRAKPRLRRPHRRALRGRRNRQLLHPVRGLVRCGSRTPFRLGVRSIGHGRPIRLRSEHPRRTRNGTWLQDFPDPQPGCLNDTRGNRSAEGSLSDRSKRDDYPGDRTARRVNMVRRRSDRGSMGRSAIDQQCCRAPRPGMGYGCLSCNACGSVGKARWFRQRLPSLYWKGVDLSFRCQQLGGRIVVRADLRAVHEVGATQGHMRKSAVSNYYNCRNRLVFAAKHLALRYQLIWILQIPMDTMRVLSRGGRAELLHAKRVLAPGGRGVIDGLRWMFSNALPSAANSPAGMNMRCARSSELKSIIATLPLRRLGKLRQTGATLLIRIGELLNLLVDDPVAAIGIFRLKLTGTARRNSKSLLTQISNREQPGRRLHHNTRLRARRANLAIESISRGPIRPQRLILWIDDDEIPQEPPSSLRRTQCRDSRYRNSKIDPHKQQYPFGVSALHHVLPMATADDAVFYPRRWLEGLTSAHTATPQVVVGYRAHGLRKWNPSSVCDLAGTKRSPPSTLSRLLYRGCPGPCIRPACWMPFEKRETPVHARSPRADDVWVLQVSATYGPKELDSIVAAS